MEITKINEDGYIECVTDTKGFKREGVCFQLGEKLYFIFDKGLAPNELIFVIVNFLEYASQPKMNGIATFSAYHTNELTSTKVVLHRIESIEIIKNKYQVIGNSISNLSKQIALVINSNLKLSNDIIDHIDNYVPFTATPYVLSAGKHYDSVAKRFHVLADLESIINGFTEEEIVEKHCLNDYLTLLKNALNNGVYRIVKFSQYYERIGFLAKNTTKTIIATYLYKNYNHDSPELISFGEEYLHIQAQLIKEKNASICRLFIIENEEPDDFLFAKMRREKQLGIEVSYLCSKEWVEARLEHPMGILDFALFDSTKAIVLGEKELFFGIQSASVIINQKEISSYIELFAINWKKANFLH